MNRKVVLHSIAYFAIFVIFTILFVVFNYPAQRLADQINRRIGTISKGALTVGSARIKPPLSLEMGEISLDVGQGRWLDMGEAVVGVRLLPLLSGKKGADIRLVNPWLDSSSTLVSSEDGWDLDVRSMDIDLSELPEEVMTLPLRLEGKVGVSMSLHSKDPSQDISSGDVNLTSGPIEISGDLLEALGFSPLRISRVLAVATIKDNLMTLGENSIEGDLTANVRGEMRIAPADYLASRLNLTVELKPGPGNRERLVPIFNLMGAQPRADGSIIFRVRGTLGRPSVTM
jgi:type II secretion system protein N